MNNRLCSNYGVVRARALIDVQKKCLELYVY